MRGVEVVRRDIADLEHAFAGEPLEKFSGNWHLHGTLGGPRHVVAVIKQQQRFVLKHKLRPGQARDDQWCKHTPQWLEKQLGRAETAHEPGDLAEPAVVKVRSHSSPGLGWPRRDGQQRLEVRLLLLT